jgi:hypothetical protein
VQPASGIFLSVGTAFQVTVKGTLKGDTFSVQEVAASN